MSGHKLWTHYIDITKEKQKEILLKNVESGKVLSIVVRKEKEE